MRTVEQINAEALRLSMRGVREMPVSDEEHRLWWDWFGTQLRRAEPRIYSLYERTQSEGVILTPVSVVASGAWAGRVSL